MRLYHGTDTDFSETDLAKSFPLKDFGRGFYSTAMYEQVERMAKRKQQAPGGKIIIQEHEFGGSTLHKSDLKALISEGAIPKWTTFISNNKSKNKGYQHDYDIIVGSIAGDGVAFLISLYTTGAVTLAQFTRMSEFRKLSNQHFSEIKKTVKLLRRIK